MNIIKNILTLTSILLLAIFISCSDDEGGDDTPEPLQAAIDISAEEIGPGETVTVSSSPSTGIPSGGVNFTWTISGSGSITYTSPNNPNGSDHEFTNGNLMIFSHGTVSDITLTPGSSGTLGIQLRIESGSTFTDFGSSVTVSGSIELTSIPENFKFEDVNPDPEIADYTFSGDVEIPSSYFEDYILLEVDEDAQVTLAGTLSSNGNYMRIRGKNGASWKGMLVTQSGNFDNLALYLNNAGSSSIESYEPSSLVIDRSSLTLPTLIFEESNGFDMYYTENVTNIVNNGGIQYSSLTPFFAPARLWPDIQPPSNVENAVVTFTGSVDTQLSFGGNVALYVGSDIKIKGGLNISDLVVFNVSGGDHTIFIEDNSALLVGGLSCNGLNFAGENGATWQGIYVGSQGFQMTSSSVVDAGSATISGSGIAGIDEKAAIYVNSPVSRFENNNIHNSGGYGLYVGGISHSQNSSNNLDGNVFENNAEAAISVLQEHASSYSIGNSFTTPDNVAAIEVRGSSSQSAGNATWSDLGGDNYYYVQDFLNIASNMTIGEGAHFKFEDNKGIDFTGIIFTATGTESNPILFEGIVSGTASWYGIKIGNNNASSITMSYATIDGGGIAMFSGASEDANLVIDGTGNVSVTNCTFSNSDGYGALIELNATEYDFEAAENNNTFTNNASGNILNRND